GPVAPGRGHGRRAVGRAHGRVPARGRGPQGDVLAGAVEASDTVNDPRLQALGTIACSVPPGAGGLGQHFDELRRYAESSAVGSVQCIYPSSHPPSEPGHIAVTPWARGARFLADIPTTKAYPWFVQAACLAFDLSAS